MDASHQANQRVQRARLCLLRAASIMAVLRDSLNGLILNRYAIGTNGIALSWNEQVEISAGVAE